jgi:hypothetical protein
VARKLIELPVIRYMCWDPRRMAVYLVSDIEVGGFFEKPWNSSIQSLDHFSPTVFYLLLLLSLIPILAP